MSAFHTFLSIPTFLLFQLTWLLHSLRRPILLVSALCLLSNPSSAIRKLKLVYTSFLYLIFCKDKKWTVPKEDPAVHFPKEFGGTAPSPVSGAKYKEKTIILIRHGESTWNDTFNPGDRNKLVFILLYIPNMIYAIAMEGYFFVSGKDSESWFFDSALSGKGVRQSEGLRKFLKKEKMRLGSGLDKREEVAVKLLLDLDYSSGDKEPSSHVVSSNLRRAISTAAIGLSDRFAASIKSNKNDKILLLPSLQEISRNPDALTILPPHGVAHPTWCDVSIPGITPSAFSALIDTQYHLGNKSLDSNGLIRLTQFCNDLFSNKLPKSNVIAAGHSLFFRSFFQLYLPRGVEHISKKKKLVNGGTVMFTLREATVGGKKQYMIDPNSVVVIYGGFGKHTKG
mmetsp:Transcript_123/g.295  ORF Transcript_123/g.295 Transcript_123/m.295 type:complete len:396 (+) Transcript_123:146-1333(+)